MANSAIVLLVCASWCELAFAVMVITIPGFCVFLCCFCLRNGIGEVVRCFVNRICKRLYLNIYLFLQVKKEKSCSLYHATIHWQNKCCQGAYS